MSDSIKHLNDDNFEKTVKEQNLVLVDFYADWCGPCRMMTPIIHEFADEMDGKVVVAKLDIDSSQKTTQAFQVTSIPTIILFKGGEEVDRFTGVLDADGLKSMVSKVSV